MGQIGVQIQPFNPDGTRSGTYTDVSQFVDINGVSQIRESLDLTDFDVGVLRNAAVKLAVNNQKGTFNDVDDDQNSIFQFKRSDSLVRFTWRINDYRFVAGLSKANDLVDATLSPDATLFEGLLSDEDLKFNALDQKMKFTVLGKEVLFDRTLVDTDDFSNGDLISDVLFAILNKSTITELLTVSASNINPTVDVTIDDKTELQDKTVAEALEQLLLFGNSTLRIVNDTVIIGPRSSSSTIAARFYSQSSDLGTENLIAARNISSGIKRTFNFISWPNGNSASDATSQTTYGARKKEVGTDLITTGSKQDTILASILSEFKDPRQEFDLIVPLTYQNLEVELLDRITIDYGPLYAEFAEDLPFCGLAVCGEATLPSGLFNFILNEEADEFEIIEKRYRFQQNEIQFSVRRVNE